MKTFIITAVIGSSLSLGSVAYCATGDTAPPAPDQPAVRGTTINPVQNLKHERRISPKAIDARKEETTHD